MLERRALVVDDDPAMAEVVRELVTASGWDATSAPDVASALAQLAAGIFGLVLSDVHMPSGDGFALLEAVRNRWPGTAVVLMSAFPAPETRTRALEAGALALLSKPFSFDELDQTLALAAAGTEAAPEPAPPDRRGAGGTADGGWAPRPGGPGAHRR